MSKKVRLFWTDNTHQFCEECELVGEDDLVAVPDPGGDLVWTKEDVFKRGLVLFLDDKGCFALHPDYIIKIDVL
ncbi:MAG: hypothetical protein ABWY25_09580 [Paenisporosarcina sp.]